MVSCTRFFLYKFLAPNTTQLYSTQETCMHVTRMVKVIGRLPIAAMFSFCCVDVVDNFLYKVNIVCLLIYFLNLGYFSYSSKNYVFPWSGRQKVWRKLFVSSKNARFLFDVSSLVSRTCTKIWCKKLAQETCASFLTVCHQHNACVTEMRRIASHQCSAGLPRTDAAA